MTDIVKSLNDKREYKYIILKNKMKVLLISDLDTEKSTAALNVNVGNFSDPESFPGLAHFLEHMLFMGTKKFPNENYFDEQLNKYGGSYNAFTDSEMTVYYFDIFNKNFEDILQIYSRFFIDPLMKEDSVDREIKAVDSENNKNLENDYWRIDQLIRSFSNPKNPFSKFGTGNIETLKHDSVREELLKFHKKYYSANIMNLVLLSNKSLKELEILANKYFCEVENKNIKINYLTKELPFNDANKINKTFRFELVQDKNLLLLVWQLPNQDKNYKEKSLHILSSLLGDETDNSILVILKNKGLINSLSSGSMDSSFNYTLFNLKIELTNSGMDNINYIISTIYEYLNILKNTDEWKRIILESKEIVEILFNYQEKYDSMTYATNLVINMEKYEAKDILTGSYLLTKENEKGILNLLEYFTKDNMMVLIGNNTLDNIKNFKKEKYYGTKYCLDKNIKIVSVKEKLNIPAINRFIPKNFNLLHNKKNNSLKSKINSDNLEIWTCENVQFKDPIAIYWIQIVSLTFNKNIKNFIMTHLIINLINDYLTPILYSSNELGYNYRINFLPYNNSLIVYVKGYNDKINIIVTEIMDCITNFKNKFSEDKFNLIKDKYYKSVLNIPLSQPWSLTTYNLESEWINEFRHYNDILKELNNINFSQIKKYYNDSMLDKIYIKSIIGGNITSNKIIDFDKYLSKNKYNEKVSSLQSMTKKYSEFSYKNKNKNDTNEAIAIYYDIGEYSYEKIAKAIVFINIIKEDFFDQLRTKEQLGYLVKCSINNFLDTYGFVQQIQSSEQNCDYLKSRINEFNKIFYKNLKTFDEENFNTIKETVINLIMEKDDNIAELLNRLIKEVMMGKYDFTRRKNIVKEVKKLKLENIVEFSKNYLINNKDKIIIKNIKN